MRPGILEISKKEKIYTKETKMQARMSRGSDNSACVDLWISTCVKDCGDTGQTRPTCLTKLTFHMHISRLVLMLNKLRGGKPKRLNGHADCQESRSITPNICCVNVMKSNTLCVRFIPLPLNEEAAHQVICQETHSLSVHICVCMFFRTCLVKVLSLQKPVS